MARRRPATFGFVVMVATTTAVSKRVDPRSHHDLGDPPRVGRAALVDRLALLGLLFKRRRVTKLPDIFAGKVRVASGEIPGLNDKFRSANARWVHDVLIVYRGMGRTTVLPLPIAAVGQPFHRSELKRMDDLRVLTLQLDGDAVAEVAVSVEGESLAVGPFLGVALASELQS